MKQSTISQLSSLLHKLKNSEGYFTIQFENTTSGKNNNNQIFCQLLNPGSQEPIRFEAVSHHFNDTINTSLESNFKSMGFDLQDGENYTKFIKFDSENAIEETVKEIVRIFERVYEVGVDGEYGFEEEMEG